MNTKMSHKLILGDGLLGSELHKQTGWDYISRKKDGIDFTDIDSYKNYILDYYEVIKEHTCLPPEPEYLYNNFHKYTLPYVIQRLFFDVFHSSHYYNLNREYYL